MAISFDSALGVHQHALKFRSQRAAVLADNLANQDTPNFKARDMDFQSVLKMAQSGDRGMGMETTHSKHLDGNMSAGYGELLYRTPTQPSIDGNTVEEHVEHAKYMENALAYQASFTFLNSKFKGLANAIRGE